MIRDLVALAINNLNELQKYKYIIVDNILYTLVISKSGANVTANDILENFKELCYVRVNSWLNRSFKNMFEDSITFHCNDSLKLYEPKPGHIVCKLIKFTK